MQDLYSRTEIEKVIRETFNMVPFMNGLDPLCEYQLGFRNEAGIPEDMVKGKYMRPMICLAVCEALGGDYQMITPAAGSIELIHRTSLVFDDIQDQGRERNQRPALWTICGLSQAVNAGLALSCYCRLALYKLRERGVPEKTVLGMWFVLEKTVLNICWGQYKDIEMSDKGSGNGMDINFGVYTDMVTGKTAALFGAAAEVGAIGAEAGHSAEGLARAFGTYLGILFQMHDDYLGVWGGEVVGKTANDLEEGKQSLPVMLSMSKDPELVKDLLDRQQFDELRGWMEKNDVLQEVMAHETRYREKVMELLARFPQNRATEYLAEMISFSMARDR